MTIQLIGSATTHEEDGTSWTVSHYIPYHTALTIVTVQRRLGVWSGMTLNGVAMTEAVSNDKSGNNDVAIYWAANPPGGASYSIVGSSSTSSNQKGACHNWGGTARTNPIRSTQSAGDTSTDADITIASTLADDMCIDCLYVNDVQNWTADAGQTTIASVTSGTTGEQFGSSYEKATGTSVAMGWSGTSTGWTQCGAAFKPGSVGNQVILFASRLQDFYDELMRGNIRTWDLQKKYRGLLAI